MSFLLRSPSSSYLQMQLHLKPDYSFFIASASMMASTSLGPSTLLSYASSSSSRQFHDFGFRLISSHEGVRVPSFRRFRIHCESKEKEVRTSSPVLESSSLSGDSALRSNEWKAVPDIWRSSADKYGDRVALVDPYHDPPLKLTYKQVEQEILDFAEGLRVVGMKANEKIGLFADNSCRWLVSDQGIMATGAVNVVRGSRSSVEELLQIYRHSESGIQKQISSSSAARKFLALTLIKVSMAYMEMKRIYEGMCLTKEQKPPMYIVALVDCLWARVVAALLWPLHTLAKMLIYKKIHASIGISKAGISGGGSLPIHVDKFFEAIGVTLQNGYGLTETSPVVCARTLSYNVLGSAGHPMHGTEFKIVDPETNNVLPPGSKGIIKVRGPQVMKGYYKNPLTTKQVLNESGWFNTGDTGWIAPHHSIGRSRRCGGVIVLEGRAKDTIVLSTGENVEPVEIEEAAMRSSLVEQILVIGQDRRRLGAIIIPNKEEAQRLDPEISKEKLKSLIYQELRKWTSECSFQVGPVLIVDEPFTIDNGLMTPTMKIRRDKVVAKYKDEIDQLYN